MPARLKRIVAAVRGYDIEIAPPSGGGSHWKATKPGFRSYPVPAHNGLKSEISDRYIDGLCRAFGIDPDDLRTKL